MNISLTSEEKSKQYQFHVILREIASLRGDLKRAESAQRPEQSYIDSIRADLELRFAELKTLPSVVCVVRIDLRDDAGLLVETTNWPSAAISHWHPVFSSPISILPNKLLCCHFSL